MFTVTVLLLEGMGTIITMYWHFPSRPACTGIFYTGIFYPDHLYWIFPYRHFPTPVLGFTAIFHTGIFSLLNTTTDDDDDDNNNNNNNRLEMI